MHLMSDHDLRQCDDTESGDAHAPAQARALLDKELVDLKDPLARPMFPRFQGTQRMRRIPPAAPMSQPLWRRQGSRRTLTGVLPGRRLGTPGHSRTQHLPVDAEQPCRPTCCAGCGQALTAASASRAHNARYEIPL